MIGIKVAWLNISAWNSSNISPFAEAIARKHRIQLVKQITNVRHQLHQSIWLNKNPKRILSEWFWMNESVNEMALNVPSELG